MATREEKSADGLPFPDERKSSRQLANIAATVRELGQAPMQAKLLDVGPKGCRLGDCRLEVGAEIWFSCPAVSRSARP